ncbi:hypothetical protein [Arsenophonus sp. PmNCSU2021_1]|uniref:hypothetical protein n=1 Tax=Arsenophonus sp. PmNCSU2021_1 TaxID=3118989 RepID=UPI002FF16CC4
MKSLLKTSTIITILIGLNSTATIADVTSQRNPVPNNNEHLVNPVLQTGSNVANNAVKASYNTVQKANTAANQFSQSSIMAPNL